jgi:hypothetical protein
MLLYIFSLVFARSEAIKKWWFYATYYCPHIYYHGDSCRMSPVATCCIFYSFVLLVVEVLMEGVLDRLDKLT